MTASRPHPAAGPGCTRTWGRSSCRWRTPSHRLGTATPLAAGRAEAMPSVTPPADKDLYLPRCTRLPARRPIGARRCPRRRGSVRPSPPEARNRCAGSPGSAGQAAAPPLPATPGAPLVQPSLRSPRGQSEHPLWGNFVIRRDTCLAMSCLAVAGGVVRPPRQLGIVKGCRVSRPAV